MKTTADLWWLLKESDKNGGRDMSDSSKKKMIPRSWAQKRSVQQEKR
jgi:hypothetical protein